MRQQRNTSWLPYLLLTLTVLFWSGNFVLGRGIRHLIPPVSLNFWRWVGALAILLPFALPRVVRQRRLVARHWKLMALLSIPSITVFNAFIYSALRSTTATNTALVNAMIPVFIVLLLWVVFKEPVKKRTAAGVLISTVGLSFIISRGNPAALATLTFSNGDLWTLGAGFAWALYSVMLRRRPPQMDPVVFLAVLVAFGVVFSLPFYVWELGRLGGFRLTAASLGSIAYVCVFPSVLAYIFWNSGVDRVGADRAGIFFHLMPVFSIVLAVLFLHERLRLFHLIGMILIFSGIALTTARGRGRGESDGK